MDTAQAQASSTTERRDWYRLSSDDALARWETNPQGLSDEEAERRLGLHGPNRLREPDTVSAWRVLLDQFTSPLIYVLLGALGVTLVIGEYTDAIVVAIVLAVNASVGFAQEYKAQNAVNALMQMVSPTARVRRDGRVRQISAQEVVPGDVVVLDEGEVVPADARLLEANGLRVDESALTGESVPADKSPKLIEEEDLTPADQRNMVFLGTAVTSGEATVVVVATGVATQIGQISEQVAAAGETKTPLQIRIERLARWITAAIMLVAVAAFGLGLLMGREVAEMLLLAVALAVSAIPEGLPVVVTVALAIGVNRMADRSALIRRLPAVDTLGSCSTILSDKTGTLTQNHMTVVSVVGSGAAVDRDSDRALRSAVEHDASLREALLTGVLCNNARYRDAEGAPDEAIGDPMEVALLEVGSRAGMRHDELDSRFPQLDKVPFRTERRYMATIHHDPDDEGPLVLVKGAVENLVEMCDNRRAANGATVEIDRQDVLAQADALAGQGMRVLAMAVGRGERTADSVADEPGGLTFVGMQALIDPPRPSAVDAVDRCHEAGIRVVMVTGDHASTAVAIGEQVHLGQAGRLPRVRTGQELSRMSDEELRAALGSTEVFARVAPEHKLRIVQCLKEDGEVVAVTGDGVNDAPALESAHLGAAMGSGTDVAKEASDMVIVDDDFASVYAAVEEGRTAFRNIRMATFLLLSTGAAEVLFILAALALDWPLPLLPAQILWLNVVTNGTDDVALAFEPGERALFLRPPRPLSEGVLDRRLLERLAVVGLWLAVMSLAVFWWQWELRDQSLTLARTTVLTSLVLFQSFQTFNCRSEDMSVLHKSLWSNKVLVAGVTLSLTLHVGAMYLPFMAELLRIEPLSVEGWAVSIGIGLTAFVVNEAHKRFRPRPDSRIDAEAGTLHTRSAAPGHRPVLRGVRST